jgi:O-antigen ligase
MAGFAALFVPYLDGFLEVRGRLLVPVLAVKLFLYALVAVSAVTIIGAVLSPRARARLIAFYAAHVPVLLPLLVLSGLAFFSGIRGTAYMDQGPRLVMFPAYWVVVVLLSMLLPLPEHRHKKFRWYLLLAFAVIAATVFVDVVDPGTFSLTSDRAAGIATNPNTAAFLLVALCCAIISFDEVRPLDFAVVVVTTLGVLATLSRGGVVMLSVVLLSYGILVVKSGWRRGTRFAFGYGVALLLLITATYGAMQRLLDQELFATGTSRIHILQDRERLFDPQESRIAVAITSWNLIRESPLVGYGSGFTYRMPVGPHNIFLSRWLDNGLLGFVTVVWLFGAMALTFFRRRSKAGLVFTTVIMFEGFFSHNLFEERIFFLLLGVLLTISYRESPEWVPTTSLSRPPMRPRVGPARSELGGAVGPLGTSS